MPLYFTSLRISFNSPSDLINAKVSSLKKKEKRKHKFKACQLRKKRHGTIVKPKQSACSNHLISTSFVSTNYSLNYSSKIQKLFGKINHDLIAKYSHICDLTRRCFPLKTGLKWPRLSSSRVANTF